nr:MBL fold metallo-hydrolase [Paracoccus saliphilus]
MISPGLHAVLDAVSATGLIISSAAASPRLAVRGPLGAIGAGIAVYSLGTQYGDRPHAARPIRMHEHRLLYAAQGAACLALARKVKDPWAQALLRGYGAFSLAAAALSSPPGPAGVEVPMGAVAADRQLGPDLAYLRCGIVNVVFLGAAGAPDRRWLLVDAGLAGSAGAIRAAARARFGASRPAAILLTHGHFDHVGVLELLAREWDAPVYAHPNEHPYLTGQRSYPPAAPEVGGGTMAELSWLFPRKPIDVSDRLRSLPADGSLPGTDQWRWIATPGHSPGHVSLWNDSARALVAGDAVVTTQQESVLAALFPQGKLQGPPAEFTLDWKAAGASVRRLAALAPEVLVTSHGPALHGAALSGALQELASGFVSRGLPNCSRYLRDTPWLLGTNLKHWSGGPPPLFSKSAVAVHFRCCTSRGTPTYPAPDRQQ